MSDSPDVHVTPEMRVVKALVLEFTGFELSNVDLGSAEFVGVGASYTPEGPVVVIGIRRGDGNFCGAALPLEDAIKLSERLLESISKVAAGEFDQPRETS